MPVRFEINDGKLEVVQSFDFPAVYLDHWAVRHFSSNAALGQRFLDALKASGGSLVVTHLNLAEIAGPDDPRHAKDAATFFEAVQPNIYFALFDIQSAIDQEKRPRDTQVRLPAPPDVELLQTGLERLDGSWQFTTAILVRAFAANRQEIRAQWHKTNQEIADQVNLVRSDETTAKKARQFTEHPSHVPTLAVMQELLRPSFLDKTLKIERNDGGDIQHAIMSIAYCDYVLLDGKWKELHERMVRRFAELCLPIRVAKVFSARQQGIELFLNELSGV